MAVKLSVRRLKYELSKDGKSNVVTSAYWNADDSEEVTKDGEKIIARGRQYGTVYFDLEKVSEVKYKKGDDIPEGKKVGDVKTEAKDPWKDNDFVEYDKLDENTIIGWVKANLGDDEVKSLEDEIARQIDAQKKPTKGQGKPW